MDTKQKRLETVSHAYSTKKRGEEEICVLDTDKIKDTATQNAIMGIQHRLEVDFELSYPIMAEACEIIAEKTLEELNSDNCDFFADADSQANVYTGVQLSYLNILNEEEISSLIKDESITSIAQACSIWHTQKVSEACEALKEYINQAV